MKSCTKLLLASKLTWFWKRKTKTNTEAETDRALMSSEGALSIFFEIQYRNAWNMTWAVLNGNTGTCTYAQTHRFFFMDTGADTEINYTLQNLKNGLSLQRAVGVTRFRVTQMWQEKTFTSAFWLVSRVSVVPPRILPSPSPIRTYFIKRASDKKPQSSHQIPLTPVLLRGGEKLALWAALLLFSFHLSLSGPGIYLPRPARERRPSSRDCRPGVMEGKMPLFHVPVSLEVQKHCFPTSTSAAQLHFRAEQKHG